MKYLCSNCFCESVNERGFCTICGYDSAKSLRSNPLALPPGTILYGRYVLGRVLGQGGFGITYIAQDFHTNRIVAIKEFFPDAMATRTSAYQVQPHTGERGAHFSYGKTCFLDEARTLAWFNGNPNIVGVQMYFEENNTAYLVMEYVEGVSFQRYLNDVGGRIFWNDAIEIMRPVLDALVVVHGRGIIHRDVTPDNIFISRDGNVKLLDFGAARYSLGDVSQSLDVVLKHGFAPKEQYSRRGRQGPYTDVYAICATMYYAVTGIKPQDAIERVDSDRLLPPSMVGVAMSSDHECMLMKGLAIKPEERYQNAAELRDALNAVQRCAGNTEGKKAPNRKKQAIICAGIAAAVLLAGIIVLVLL